MKKFKKTFFLSVLFPLLLGGVFYFLPFPGNVPVLMYHFIGSEENAKQSSNFVTLETFEKQMCFLNKMGYRVISLGEFADIRDGKRKARGREIAITFDDGNPSVFEKAWPVMQRYQIPSTQFLISQGLESGTYGSVKFEVIRPLLNEPLLTWGSHTRSHPFLSELSSEDQKSEISGSKQELEARLGKTVDFFAYPFGDWNASAESWVQSAGYRCAFTTSPKKLKGAMLDRFRLTRVKISESDRNYFIFWVKISGLYEAFKLTRHRFNRKVNL